MIEVRNLTKKYGDKTAVEGLTFSVKPGVVTGFLGPNGAGKSTTMRMIVGLDNPTKGEALVGGQPYKSYSRPLSKVGCLIDAGWTHRNRSAGAHLKFIAAAGGVPMSRVGECLDLVGLGSVAGKKVGGFSLGMRQRLGLAGAMLGDPEVLIFDEPVNGLDPEGILWVRHFMQARAAEGRTVLVSSHLLSEMAQTAQDLVVIGRGRLRAQTSVDDFVSKTAATHVRTPDRVEFHRAAVEAGFAVRWDEIDGGLLIDDRPPAEVGEFAFSHGFVIHELAERRASLEEAFMALTESDVEYHGEDGTPGAATTGDAGRGSAYHGEDGTPGAATTGDAGRGSAYHGEDGTPVTTVDEDTPAPAPAPSRAVAPPTAPPAGPPTPPRGPRPDDLTIGGGVSIGYRLGQGGIAPGRWEDAR